MNWKPFCYIILGAIIQAIGVALLKNGMDAFSANALIKIPAFILMMIGFPLYNLGLKSIKLSVAQPLFSTTLFLTCTLLSLLLLHETIKVNQIFGIVIILAGVFYFISSGEKKLKGRTNMQAMKANEKSPWDCEALPMVFHGRFYTKIMLSIDFLRNRINGL